MVDTERPSDRAVIERVLAGDADAFAHLVHRYQGRYIRFAARMVGSVSDGEDVLQSAFLRAYRHLRHCREPDNFGAWFHRIVVNECRTALRTRGRHDGRFGKQADDCDDVAVEDERPDSGFDDHLQRALNALPADQREAVLLKYVDDLGYDEMAKVTGAGVSALKMRTKRGIARLHALLNGVSHAG